MKWVKRIGIGIGVLLVLFVGFVVVFFYVLHPKSRAAPNVHAPTTPEVIARGEYLVRHVTGCALCHSPLDEMKPGDEVDESQLFAGREFPVKDMGFPGILNGPNISSDKDAGIGAWTDGEVMRAIREGVDRNGKTLFPIMPYQHFRQLTDDDTLAIIAYLRTVKPQSKKLPRTTVPFPISMFIRLAPAPLTSSPPAWPTDPTARGKILLEVMSCIDCHSPMVKGKLVEGKHFAGGNKFKGPFGTVYTPNITPDQATGIGAYSDDDLMRVLKEGKGKDGRALYVMPWRAYQGASDEDLKAVIAGLRSLPAISNVVPASQITAK